MYLVRLEKEARLYRRAFCILRSDFSTAKEVITVSIRSIAGDILFLVLARFCGLFYLC